MEASALHWIVRYECSVIIPMDVYDALLIGEIKDESLRGYLR
jgi:hypothetical protein